MSKILIFFPHNFFKPIQGSNVRCYDLVKFFSEKKFTIDVLSWSQPNEKGWEGQNIHEDNLLRNVYLTPSPEGTKKLFRFTKKIPFLKKLAQYIFPKVIRRIPNLVDDQLTKKITELQEQHQYDYILVNYVFWTNLIAPFENQSKRPTFLIETHDCISKQLHFHYGKMVNFEKCIQDEVSKLNRFDHVISISHEEKELFEKNGAKTPVHYIPQLLRSRWENLPDKEIDLLYVAGDSESNIVSAKWFFKEVFPKIDSKIRLTVVGKIGTHVPDLPNIHKIPFIKDLSSVYQKSKVVLSPILAGTGLKIKVIEAMSFGLPIVGTEKALDGFQIRANTGLCISNDAATQVDFIHKLLSDKEFYQQQKEMTKIYFKNYFDAETIVYPELEKMLEN